MWPIAHEKVGLLGCDLRRKFTYGITVVRETVGL